MSVAANTILKPVSMATNACLISIPSIFTTSKTTYSHLSICFKPTKLQLCCSYSSSLPVPCLISREKKESISRASTISAQQQDNQVNFNWGDSVNEFEGGETDGNVEPPEEAKVYVGNLSYDVDSERLAELFTQAGVVEISEVIYNRETEQSRGFGFVTMSTVEEAEKAVEMFHRYDLNGRTLTVNKAAPRGSRPERTERAPRVFEGSSRIYVGNLPWTVDDQSLEQAFSEYGKVVSARVVSDRETGRSRGFGFVAMSSESEMNDAIANLDGQNLDGRAIRVNVAEDKPRQRRF